MILKTAVESRQSTQALDAPSKFQKLLITNNADDTSLHEINQHEKQHKLVLSNPVKL